MLMSIKTAAGSDANRLRHPDNCRRGFSVLYGDSARRGFTLIELMIVVAIIAVLAAIAVLSFISYRQKSAIASAVASAHTIRTAMLNAASSTNDGGFPDAAELAIWTNLVTICNRHGAQLSETAERSGFQNFMHYIPVDLGGDGRVDEFYLVLRTGGGVPNTLTGAQIELSPAGISKQTY